MNIVMVTNTYLPHMGGVANSVHAFSVMYRELGHKVLVVAPDFPDQDPSEDDVHRVPAIQNFNGSDFSVSLPLPNDLHAHLREFAPDLIHSHHPFLLGDTALRCAADLDIPLVYTYHTRYEYYTHYVPADSPTIQDLVVNLATEYCDQCDQVIAPSESIRQLLLERGIRSPIQAIPTGIDLARFGAGSRQAFAARHGLPSGAFVAGHVGRLALEKNCVFLAKALVRFVQQAPERHALVVGDGDEREAFRAQFSEAGVADRLVLPGSLRGKALADAYASMDVFAFASKTETQGMVLAEAMAAGLPVVALDAPGSRDIVEEGHNGLNVRTESVEVFADALGEVAALPRERRDAMRSAARQTAKRYDQASCATEVLELYDRVCGRFEHRPESESDLLDSLQRRLNQEWEIWSARINAVNETLSGDGPRREDP